MEEIIEQLRERNETVPIPLELPEEDDLVEIEEQLLVPLPDDLKDFLLSVSDVVCGSIEPVTVMDPHSHTYLPEVASVAWENGLPRELIPICEIADGIYAISEDGDVMLWSDDEDVEHWDTIWDWAESVWLES